MLIGAPDEWTSFDRTVYQNGGVVRRYNPDGSLVSVAPTEALITNGRLGATISALQDIDGDSIGDVAISIPGAQAGQPVRFYSGRDFHLLQIGRAVQSAIGAIAVAGGDVDGDGFADVISLFPGRDRATAVSSLGIVEPVRISVASPSGNFLAFDSRFAGT